MRVFAFFQFMAVAAVALTLPPAAWPASHRDCFRRTIHELDVNPRASRASAMKKDPRVGAVYDKAYEHVAPAVIGAADQILRDAAKQSQAKVMFIARDGIGGYEVAKILIKRFPERYPGLTQGSIKYVFLNKHTLRSEHAKRYLQQQGVENGTPTYFFDLGWYGSMESNYKMLTQQAAGDYKGLRLMLSPDSQRAYISLRDTSGPYASIPGNPAVHFMEDTFSGVQPRPSQLTIAENGTVAPVFPDQAYTGTDYDMRVFALEALKDSAQDIALGDLNALTPDHARKKLFELVGNPEAYKPIMVPHERH